MACAPRDILVEQVQTAPIQNYIVTSGSLPTYDIRFSHAIKALFWSARNKSILPARSNYTTSQQLPIGIAGAAAGSSVTSAPDGGVLLPTNLGVVDFNQGSDPIINTTLIYENTQRLYQMGSDFFSMVDPWYCAPVIPLDTGYHLYSYSLDFFCIDPMGSTNYGKLTNVSISPAPSSDASNSAVANVPATNANPNPLNYGASYEFVVTAVNNNIISSKSSDKKATANINLLDKQFNRLVSCC
jgi:hypothetical protein